MTIVGYGTTAPPPGGPSDTSNYDLLRRWGTSTVDHVLDQDWVTFNRDPVTVCFGDSGAPTFFDGRVVAIASDGGADCGSADVRARVDGDVAGRLEAGGLEAFRLFPDAFLRAADRRRLLPVVHSHSSSGRPSPALAAVPYARKPRRRKALAGRSPPEHRPEHRTKVFGAMRECKSSERPSVRPNGRKTL